mmetsp:Transcript_39909/g.113995  ORF Transcript_39909/g.113995 Transcript_39909/m.113995 type:complete len:222 (-) Transcript_39909:340-1005(-)
MAPAVLPSGAGTLGRECHARCPREFVAAVRPEDVACWMYCLHPGALRAGNIGTMQLRLRGLCAACDVLSEHVSLMMVAIAHYGHRTIILNVLNSGAYPAIVLQPDQHSLAGLVSVSSCHDEFVLGRRSHYLSPLPNLQQYVIQPEVLSHWVWPVIPHGKKSHEAELVCRCPKLVDCPVPDIQPLSHQIVEGTVAERVAVFPHNVVAAHCEARVQCSHQLGR